jgi:hypothetical protein
VVTEKSRDQPFETRKKIHIILHSFRNTGEGTFQGGVGLHNILITVSPNTDHAVDWDRLELEPGHNFMDRLVVVDGPLEHGQHQTLIFIVQHLSNFIFFKNMNNYL